MPKCVVFASGRGSNFIAIHKYLLAQSQANTLVALVSDKKDCGACVYAKDNNIPIIILDYKGKSRETAEEPALAFLTSNNISLVVLAGFMRILSPQFVSQFRKKIVNLHPSLLPKYPGAHGIRDSFASKDKELGISIHWVDEGVDTGEILVQESFFRLETNTLEEIETKIHELEHLAYPRTVFNLLEELKKSEASV